MSERLVSNARTLEGDAVDVLLADGRIESVSEAGALEGTVDDEYDAAGTLLTPAFTEPHTHLDMALTAGDPRWNASGTLREGIELWQEYKSTLERDDVRDRAKRVLEQFAANGVTRVRTHADTTEQTLGGLDALLELKRDVADSIDVQIVAFPQDGLLTDPEHETLLGEAMEMGADLVGGIPHFEYTSEDGTQAVKTAFDIAERYSCGIDLHIDEIDDPGSRFTEVLASEAIKRGFDGNVTASHATAMHSYPNAYASRLVEMLAESGVSVITNPLDNAVLQGRHDGYPRRRGHTRIDELHEAGVTVGIGHDSVMDPVYHYGCADPLDAAYVLVHFAHMSGYGDVGTLWRMLTEANADIFGVEEADYGIKDGAEASFVVFDSETPFEALRKRDPGRLVFSHGQVIARSEEKTAVGLDDSEAAVGLW